MFQHFQVIYEDLPANLCAIRDRVELLESSILQDSKSGTDEPDNIDSQKELPERKESYSTTPASILLEHFREGHDKPEARIPRASPRIRKRPLVAGLQRDFKILERELLKFIAEQVLTLY